jgi:hypothetical protein
MDVADLFVALTISNQPVAGSIIDSAIRDLSWMVSLLEMDTPDPNKP